LCTFQRVGSVPFVPINLDCTIRFVYLKNGVNIEALSPDLNYSFGGHLHITANEASSLRMELEGLIATYEVIPPDVHPLHYMDNTEAIAIHDNLYRYGFRKLMRKAYRRTITLLWHRMQERGAHLTVLWSSPPER
jgi:hypothetical protein